MCIGILDPKPKHTTTGWKVFNTRNSCLRGQYHTHYSFTEGEWLKDPKHEFLPTSYYPQNYYTGFHFYRHKNDAIAEMYRSLASAVRKVKCRKITATGIQEGCEVACAREIYIYPEKVKS